MADNVTYQSTTPATPPSATVVSTDEGGSGAHVQRMKLCYSANASETHVTADADGLLVNLGANNDVTVTGTVTVGSHAVTNAGTFAVQVDGTALTRLTDIETNTDSGAVVGNGLAATAQRVTLASDSTGVLAATQSGAWNVTNISGTVSLPTGAATAAKQPALGIAGTASADVLTVQGIASMTALKVDGSAVTQPVSGTVSAAQSGTWTVTGTGGTFPVTDSGGSLTVDAPVATPVFVRLSDGAAAITTLPVSLASVPSHAVTNAGTFAVQVDNTVTVGSHAVTNAGTFAVQVSSALPAGSNAIGKLAANSGVDIGDVDVTSIAAGDNNIGNVDIVTVPADPFGANADAASASGSISAKLRFIASTGIPITGTVTVGSHAVTNAGTFAVQESGGALTALQIMDDWDNAASDGASVSGDVAHDAVDAGEPVKIGAKAETSPKAVTLVADGDRTDLLADADGQLIVKLGTSGADHVSEAVSDTGGTSTAFTNFGAVASTKNAITAISVFRTDAGSTLAYIDFRDGTGGAVLWRMPLPAGGGAVLSLGGAPIFKTSANTALAYDVSAALTTVYISVSGFQTKV